MKLFMRRAEGHNSIIRSRSSWGHWHVTVKNTGRILRRNLRTEQDQSR